MTSRDAATAPPGGRTGPAASRPPQLVVICDGVVHSRALPASGVLVLGRSSECDVVIDHESISRRHARLELGPTLRIVDLGSANGTLVGGRAIAANRPVELVAHEVVELGSAMMIVQAHAALGRPRRVWAHGDFEDKLDEECARGGALAVVRIRCERAPPPPTLETILLGALRAGDSLASYAPGEYHALLVDVSADEAPTLGNALVTALRGHGLDVRVGIACAPAEGTTAATLVAVAGAKLAPIGAPAIVAPPASGAMARVDRVIERVAVGTISVLLLGETGVGKEILAEQLHARSPRHAKPLLRLNCAALSESLLESELFGHDKGAFTGAVTAKPGLLESAHGGTVFLDEIGELAMAAQVKLLRVIETREVTRVGALAPRAIDVRFVAATHRDLEAAIVHGTFRQDLYFRLGGIAIVVPPLRERVEEIEPLARAFVAAAARAAGRREPKLSHAALDALRAYSWPGNIRELRNVIERAVLLCDDTIGVAELPAEKLASTLRVPATEADATAAPLAASLEPLKAELADAERARILDTLDRCAGNQSQAARQLGISRGTLIARLESYGIPRPRKRR